jgi:release factor glutamine methyltransferase
VKAKELIREGRKTLVAARKNFSWSGDETQQATDLLAHALGSDPEPNEVVPAGTARKFERYIARRATGEPLPYITGFIEFGDLKLIVRNGAFVPRATSEFMANEAIRRIARRSGRPVAVDLATGIGPVALSVAHAVRRAQVYGLDINPRALAIGRENARALKLRNINFLKGDLFAPLPAHLRGKVDVITIHPPDVPRQDVRGLPRELAAFEPYESLTDNSTTGTGIVERVANGSPEWLRPGGWLLIEVDSEAARPVRSALSRTRQYRDLRSIVGQWSFSRLVVART